MLNAVLESKARISAPADHDISRCREDTLLSAVFERLGYLPPSLAWKILSEATSELASFRYATIYSLSFWPSWEPAAGDGRRVEPDLFMQVGLGDPEVRMDIIVEAKRNASTNQNPEQWFRQVRAYLKARREDTLGEVGSRLVVLAVGGLRRNEGGRIRQLKQAFEALYENHSDEADGLEVSIATAAWRDVLDAIATRETSEIEQTGRVLTDIRRSIEFGGFVRRRSFEQLHVSTSWKFRYLTFEER